MTTNNHSMPVQQQQDVPADQTERTHSRRAFIPKSDIYETENEIIVLADVPGARDTDVDVTLEKDVLTINAFVNPVRSRGYELAYAEYEEGDYQRSFRLSDEIDRDHIDAAVSNGVLRLCLPKAPAARARKIAVKAK
jgi:HSP20 family protein